VRRRGPALRRDYRIVGCIYCLDPQSIGASADVPYRIEPPYASLDARDDVRMHPECYRSFVFSIWATLGLAPIPEGFFP
jgi:hypothetical protein